MTFLEEGACNAPRMNADLDDILNDLNLPDNDGINTDIEALLHSDDSEETKHVTLKRREDSGITLNGRN